MTWAPTARQMSSKTRVNLLSRRAASSHGDSLPTLGSTTAGATVFFLLFDRNASWEQSPPRPVSAGATVIGDSDRLAASAASLLR
jgi:hypothetical protein